MDGKCVLANELISQWIIRDRMGFFRTRYFLLDLPLLTAFSIDLSISRLIDEFGCELG